METNIQKLFSQCVAITMCSLFPFIHMNFTKEKKSKEKPRSDE